MHLVELSRVAAQAQALRHVQESQLQFGHGSKAVLDELLRHRVVGATAETQHMIANKLLSSA